jgi:hypothetical protein
MALIAIVHAELSARFRGEANNDSSLKMRHPWNRAMSEFVGTLFAGVQHDPDEQQVLR